MRIDYTKPIVTKDGQPVRILCTDRKFPAGYPVVALVGDRQSIHTYTIEGYEWLAPLPYTDEDKLALFNTPTLAGKPHLISKTDLLEAISCLPLDYSATQYDIDKLIANLSKLGIEVVWED